MDGGALKATVHGVLSQTWLSDFTFTFHFDALEKEMATHSSVLAWRILGTGEPGGLLSMESHGVRHDWSDLAKGLFMFMHGQSSLILWDPMDCSPPGSSVHGIFQARILEQVAISYYRGSSWSRDWTCVSCISCIGSQIFYHWEAQFIQCFKDHGWG